MYFKKSLVLSGAADENTKAVLSVESMPGGVHGSVRLYNFKEEPGGILTLGIMEEGKVHKAGLTKKSPFFYTFMTEEVRGLEKFSTAVVNTVGAKPFPILYGASDGQYSGEEALASCISSFTEKATSTFQTAGQTCLRPAGESFKMDEVKKVLDNAGVDFSDEEKDKIEEAIDAELAKKPDCASCKYREVFFEEGCCKEIMDCEDVEVSFLNRADTASVNQQKKHLYPETANDKPKEVKSEPEIFFNTIREEVDKLFEENVSEDILTSIIPNSKWAKVEYEVTGEFYAVGLIYEGKEIRYLAYAVPGVYDEVPPKELLGYPIFLPLDENKPEGFGYYISYQDALTGEEVKAKII